MTELPFSGDEPRCAKCGNDEASYRYVQGTPSLIYPATPDRMMRTCQRCGHQWLELCADHCEDDSVKTPIQEAT